MGVEGLAEEVVGTGRAAGLDEVGIADAAVFDAERAALVERRAAGLDGGMQFTYRNPERSTDPSRTLPGVRRLVVGARSYARRPAPEPDPDSGPRGRVARYAWRDHYADLRRALEVMAAVLAREGFRTVVLADDNALVDRAAAVRAGIGWYGKNANVLLPGRGSWFVLGAVLTDAELPVAEPVPDGCGTCRRCLDHGCPTDAIVAPGVVDARRCLAWTVQAPGVMPRHQRSPLGDRIYGCDDCQEVCPPSRVELTRAPVASDADESSVDLVAMVEADDEDLMAAHGRWYVPRRDPRYLRRNAVVALGNVADPRDDRVVEALRRVLRGTDDLVAAHAVWAVRRLGREDLLRELPVGLRSGEAVATELAADTDVRPDLVAR